MRSITRKELQRIYASECKALQAANKGKAWKVQFDANYELCFDGVESAMRIKYVDGDGAKRVHSSEL